MKIIKIPPPVHLRDVNNKLLLEEQSNNPIVITFKEMLEGTLLIDNKFGESLKTISLAAKIKNKLTKNNEVLELENEEWEKLWEVTQHPTNGYVPKWSIQLMDFFLAIEAATDG